MHHHIGDRRHRQVELQRLPVRPVIEGDVHAELRARIQQALSIRVLSSHPHEVVRGNTVAAVGEQLPALAVIVGAKDIRLEVIETVTVYRDKRPSRIVGRKVDRIDRAPLGQGPRA